MNFVVLWFVYKKQTKNLIKIEKQKLNKKNTENNQLRIFDRIKKKKSKQISKQKEKSFTSNFGILICEHVCILK